MSSVGNSFEDASKIAYLATRTFENDLFSYTPTYNDSTQVRSGILAAPIAGATSVTCPVGRFLYETGKKLIPGAHPGVRTLMVGVFDPVSFLSGFIDPNSEVFTRMNEDKSAMLDTLTTAGTLDFGVFGNNPNGNTSDLADPVFTRGDVTALGQATITGDITSEAGDITAIVGSVLAGNTFGLRTGAGGTVTQSTSKSTGVTLSKSTGQITMNNATLNAGIAVSFVVTNVLCDANDFVALQVIGGVSSVFNYRVVAVPGAGTFTINVQNVTGGNLSEAILIQYVLIKAVTA